MLLQLYQKPLLKKQPMQRLPYWRVQLTKFWGWYDFSKNRAIKIFHNLIEENKLKALFNVNLYACKGLSLAQIIVSSSS